MKRARSGSAPGPSGVPYKVYKNCPMLRRRLWKHLRSVWKRGKLAEQWRTAEGCFVPKEEDSSKLANSALLGYKAWRENFLSIIARRMTSFLLFNKYIDTAVQKGGVPGISGCIEHTAVVTQLIREAKEDKKDLALIWLDLANAFGSIPHKIIEVTLQKYHIPDRVTTLLMDYYNNFYMRFTAGK